MEIRVLHNTNEDENEDEDEKRLALQAITDRGGRRSLFPVVVADMLCGEFCYPE